MEAKELMIGDWIRNDFGELQQIVEIRNDGVMLAYNDIYPYDKIEPIPLTPEILERNEFGYIESDSKLSHYYPGKPRYCTNMDIHIGTDRKGTFWLNYYNNSIYGLKYVHELQHALRLCGIDKEITL